MSAESLLQALLETSLATSAAALLVLALRLPVRRAFGARTAYALWLLLPVATIAVLLPSRRAEVVVQYEPVVAATDVDAAAATPAASGIDPAPFVLIAWAAGALALAGLFAIRQRRFRRTLGALQAQPDGSWRAASSQAGPAVLGALRGRVVLPADFDARYTPLQRELVLRHERVHVQRGDPAANLLAAALRCLHWFNPLLHYAAARFRFDQELAADAVVLAQRPDARRDYADAMLCTQLLSDPPPLGCHWQPAHPLKERIMMLKQPLPGARRMLAGAMLAVTLSLGAGYAAWAAQPARSADTNFDPAQPALRITLNVGGKAMMRHESLATLGRKDSMLQASDGFGIDYEITSLTDDLAELSARVTCRGEVLSRPVVQFRRGTHASLAVEGPSDCATQQASFDLLYGTAGELRDASRPELGSAERTDASYARLTPPTYPADAIAEKARGTVLLRVLVGIDGAPAQIDIERSSGDARLDASARAEVAQWMFNPVRENGVPEAGWVLVPVTFDLGRAPAAALPSGALDEIHIRPGAQG